MRKTFLLLVSTLVFAACSSQAPTDEAQLLTFDELTKTPGYAWFPAEMASYNPDPSMVDSVTMHFRPSEQKVCIFVKPTCSCSGTKRLFPRTVKTLQEAGIDMSKVEFWSMRSATDKHPYQDEVTLHGLPTIVVLRNGVPAGRIEETDFTESNADTLIANAVSK